VAKVARDAIMAELARDYPNHGFDRHKGYSTAEHFAAIARYGVTPQHRRSFRPVQLALGLV
jgi:ribonuclease HII